VVVPRWWCVVVPEAVVAPTPLLGSLPWSPVLAVVLGDGIVYMIYFALCFVASVADD